MFPPISPDLMSTPTHRVPARAPYVPPALEALGAWSALTLQQTVPVTGDHAVYVALAQTHRK